MVNQIVVGVTKAVSDRFGKGGIADRMIWFNGFPFLDNKEEHSFGVPVSQVVTTDVTILPAEGLSLSDVETILKDNKFQGYPIVENQTSKILLGYIGRTELRYAIDRTRRENMVSPSAKCYFTPPTTRSTMTPASAIAPSVTFDTMAATAGQTSIDFSRFIDPTPLTVHPRLPLETVMELFKKMGPRVILIEHRGKLTGLVTVKDCLKYQFKAEALENPKDDSAIEDGQARIWDGLNSIVNLLRNKISGVGYGRLRLGDFRIPTDGGSSDGGSPSEGQDGRERDAALDLELEDRR
jgi:chloride channel 3/4/5